MQNARTYSKTVLIAGDLASLLSIFFTSYLGLMAGWVFR